MVYNLTIVWISVRKVNYAKRIPHVTILRRRNDDRKNYYTEL